MSNIDQTPRDENGKRNGRWIIHWSNGKIMYIIDYSNNIPNGLYKENFSNGNVSSFGNYKLGIKVGYWYYFFKQNEYYLCLI